MFYWTFTQNWFKIKSTLQHQDLWHCLLVVFISLMQSENEAQFFNITSLFFLSAVLHLDQ